MTTDSSLLSSLDKKIAAAERRTPQKLQRLIVLAKLYEMSGSKSPEEMLHIEYEYLEELSKWAK